MIPLEYEGLKFNSNNQPTPHNPLQRNPNVSDICEVQYVQAYSVAGLR
jgi:hypothetical protein